MYSSNEKAIDIRPREHRLQCHDLSVLVAYASLLTSLPPGRKAYSLKEAYDANTTPSHWLTHKIVVSLTHHKMIKLLPATALSHCKIVIEHRNDDLHLKSILREINRRKVSYLDKDLLSITRHYLKANLHAHISEQLHNAGINLDIREGDFETFTAALERQSLSELCMIVWQTVQSLTRPDLRFYSLSEDSLSGIAEQIEDSCLEQLARYESKNRAIKPFKFSKIKRSSLSLVLFNSVLGINNNYYKRSLQEIWNQYA